MLTGDNRRTAGAVAGKLGLNAVESELEPLEKSLLYTLPNSFPKNWRL